MITHRQNVFLFLYFSLVNFLTIYILSVCSHLLHADRNECAPIEFRSVLLILFCKFLLFFLYFYPSNSMIVYVCCVCFFIFYKCKHADTVWKQLFQFDTISYFLWLNLCLCKSNIFYFYFNILFAKNRKIGSVELMFKRIK